MSMPQNRKTRIAASRIPHQNSEPPLPPYYTPSVGTGFHSLSAELALEILQIFRASLAGPSYFAPICLISKHFNALATTLLYEDIHIRRKATGIAFSRTLAAVPARGELVKQIHAVDEDGASFMPQWKDSEEIPKSILLGQVLRRTPNLEVLHLIHFCGSNISMEKKEEYWKNIFTPLANIPTLNELALQDSTVNARHLPALPQVTKLFVASGHVTKLAASSLPSLTHFSIKTEMDWQGDKELQSLLWSVLRGGTVTFLVLQGRISEEVVKKILEEDLKSGGELLIVDLPFSFGDEGGGEGGDGEEENRTRTPLANALPSKGVPSSSDDKVEPRMMNLFFEITVPALNQVPRYLATIRSFCALSAGKRGRITDGGVLMIVQGVNEEDEELREKLEGMIDAALESVAVTVKKEVELRNYWGSRVNISFGF